MPKVTARGRLGHPGEDARVAPSADAEHAADVEAAVADVWGGRSGGGLSWFVHRRRIRAGQARPNWTNGRDISAGQSAGPSSLTRCPASSILSRGHVDRSPAPVIGSGWALRNRWSPDWMVSLARLTSRDVCDQQCVDCAVGGVGRRQQPCVSHRGRRNHRRSERRARVERACNAALGGNVGQAVAGAISTGTHGGDPTQPPLADAGGGDACRRRRVGGSSGSTGKRADYRRPQVANALPCKDTGHPGRRLFNSLLSECGRFGVIFLRPGVRPNSALRSGP